jgi:hypothetical protein
MNAATAKRAMREFLKVIEEAQAMEAAGAVGGNLDDTLRHAKELLDIMEQALIDVDHYQHVQLFAAARILRRKLNQLRDHQSRRAH